ncbi:uncharacterized protein [Haliotis asinina]|uniref:uncharacterized protein isoform X1 n=1 Tax=Haliotis asinina TaxID=109174 RepID=UPI0035321FD8
MLHGTVIVFIAAFVSAIPSSRSQDFTSACPNFAPDLAGCSSTLIQQGVSMIGLFTDMSKGLDVESAIADSFCQSKTKTAIVDFYECIYKKISPCTPSEWQKIMPSLDQRKQALDYMCDNIDDMDTKCVESSETTIALQSCIMNGSKGDSNLSTADEYLASFCSVSQLSESCAKTAYGSCPKRTAEVVAEINKYSRPAGCDACVSRPSLLLLVSVLTFMLALLK